MAERLEGKAKEQYAQARRRIDELTMRLERERGEERAERRPPAKAVAISPLNGSPDMIFLKVMFVLAAGLGAFLYWHH